MLFKTFFLENEKIWTGIDTVPLYHPNLSVGQAILDALELNPNKICQISDDTGYQMTSQEMYDLIVRIATNFCTRTNFKKGDIVCIAAKNSKNVAPVTFASLLCGLTVSTMDPDFDEAEVTHSMGLTKPKVVFCDENNRGTVQRSLKTLGLEAEISIVGDLMKLLEPNAEEQNFIIPNLGDISKLVAVILCSSGTTGMPKGVCISHPAILLQLRGPWPVNVDDVLFGFSSLYWLSGWINLLNGTLRGATRIITTQSYTPELYLTLIEKYRISAIISAPHQMSLMLRCDKMKTTNLKSLKVVFVGGSYVSDSLRGELKKILPNARIAVAYGCSEIAGFTSSTYSTDRSGSVGLVAPSVSVKIIDEDDNLLGCNQTGEICAKSLYPFLGYINNKEATDATIDKEGFIRSGDLGYFDQDGFLHCIDRKKEILKYCNHQISPTEIEAVILRIPDVVAVCVVGIPDEVATDLPAALIVRKNEDLTSETVYNYVAKNVSDHKLLRGGVYFVKELPLTHSGKIKRPEAKAIVSKRYSELKHTN